MKLGLIGCPLGHSRSPEIHQSLIGADYRLFELQEDEVQAFLEKRDFDGLNVTIPYKQKVMPYLDRTDPLAEQCGAVNTIVCRNGILTGYNTDVIGLQQMIEAHGFDLAGLHTAILGSGGASKAAVQAVLKLGGIPHVISRTGKDGALTYAQMYAREDMFRCLINTTPVGMVPRNDETPADLSRFSHLSYVIDIVANPLRTRLQFEAKLRGIPAIGGFEMLVYQAAAADFLFTGTKPSQEDSDRCIRQLLNRQRNIVLIGMPTSGKTTLSAMLEKMTGMERIEMDEVLEETLQMPIRTCFEEKGEAWFRQAEKDLARQLRSGGGRIISSGGGVIKDEETMRYLSENGIICRISRDPGKLFPTDSRPLADSLAAVRRLAAEREPLYRKYCDIQIDNNTAPEDAAQQIVERTGIAV